MATVILTTSTDLGAPVIYQLMGLSTDARLLTLPDGSALPDGSTLHVVDTGEQYVFFAGAWHPDLRLARAIRLAAAL